MVNGSIYIITLPLHKISKKTNGYGHEMLQSQTNPQHREGETQKTKNHTTIITEHFSELSTRLGSSGLQIVKFKQSK